MVTVIKCVSYFPFLWNNMYTSTYKPHAGQSFLYFYTWLYVFILSRYLFWIIQVLTNKKTGVCGSALSLYFVVHVRLYRAWTVTATYGFGSERERFNGKTHIADELAIAMSAKVGPRPFASCDASDTQKQVPSKMTETNAILEDFIAKIKRLPGNTYARDCFQLANNLIKQLRNTYTSYLNRTNNVNILLFSNSFPTRKIQFTQIIKMSLSTFRATTVGVFWRRVSITSFGLVSPGRSGFSRHFRDAIPHSACAWQR